MYALNDIKTIHLEITSKCQASCPMCVRNIQGGLENPYLVLDEITITQFKEWFPVEFIKQLNKLYMCGNTGDPIVAKDTLEIFKYLRANNPTIELSMNTNASARSKQWWQELAQTKVIVRFGIDGLADTHALYRIGTDWQKIISNATTFIQAGGDAVWDMLVFQHNLHQIEACEKLSKELGFKQFISKHTSRFKNDEHIVLDYTGKVSHILQPSSKSKNITELIKEAGVSSITCKVKDEKSLYVNAHGVINPCCWLDFDGVPPSSIASKDYKSKITPMSLKTNTLDEIFETDFFNSIEKSWSNEPLIQCNKQCGKIDKFNEQFQ